MYRLILRHAFYLSVILLSLFSNNCLHNKDKFEETEIRVEPSFSTRGLQITLQLYTEDKISDLSYALAKDELPQTSPISTNKRLGIKASWNVENQGATLK